MSEQEPVPLLDVTRNSEDYTRELTSTFEAVVASGRFILGDEVSAFEAEMAANIGAKHAIGVSSGTDALLLALMSLGIGVGDEVICPTFTFFATAGSIWRVGAKPVFVDCAPESFNLDPAGVRAAITSKTRAIMPVHLFGQCAPMDEISDIARRHDLAVIEDAAQAIGAAIDSRQAGTFGDFGAFSFFPSKNFGGFGDAGLVTTSRDDLAERARVLRVHGGERRYYHREVGGNFRIDALQAALLRVKLRHKGIGAEGRRQHASHYDQALTDAGITGPDAPLTLPDRELGEHTFNQYTLTARTPEIRSAMLEELASHGIGHAVYYPVPLHLQECFASCSYAAGDFPRAEALSGRVFSIPVFPELTESERDRVVAVLIAAAKAAC